MKLEQIKDPKLVSRIEDALRAAGNLRKELSTACPKPGKRIRQDTKPLMNKLEQEYYDRYLFGRLEVSVSIQSIRFKLANGVWYKPDFYTDGNMVSYRQAIEVKGPHAFRGGFENLKMAAHQYPWIKWILVWKEEGVWMHQTILP